MKAALILWVTVAVTGAACRWLWQAYKRSPSVVEDINIVLAAIVLVPLFIVLCVAAVMLSIGPVMWAWRN